MLTKNQLKFSYFPIHLDTLHIPLSYSKDVSFFPMTFPHGDFRGLFCPGGTVAEPDKKSYPQDTRVSLMQWFPVSFFAPTRLKMNDSSALCGRFPLQDQEGGHS